MVVVGTELTRRDFEGIAALVRIVAVAPLSQCLARVIVTLALINAFAPSPIAAAGPEPPSDPLAPASAGQIHHDRDRTDARAYVMLRALLPSLS